MSVLKFEAFHFLRTSLYIKENTDNIVIKVANLIGVKIKNEDNSVSHRLQTSKSYKGRNKEIPPIIVKFTRRNIKESLYEIKIHGNQYNLHLSKRVS